MRASIQAATASIITPKSFLTRSIHGPALGSSLPAEAPTARSGVPMPMLMANSAAPPRTICPVSLMTIRAPTRAGPTQVVTMSAESAPMTATPPIEPLLWRLLTFGQPRLDRRRHLHGEQAEHRQRQRHEQCREQRQHPPLLEQRLHLLAGRCGRKACHGVGEGHAQHIAQREREGTAGGHGFAAAEDDPREDRHHGQYAGGEGKQQSCQVEPGEHREQAGIAQKVRKAILLAGAGAGASGRAAADRSRPRPRGKLHGECLGDGRIAQTLVRAPLIGDFQRQLECAAAGARHGQYGVQLVVVDLLAAEVLVVLHLAVGQLQCTQLRGSALGRDLDARPVEVVALGDLEVQAHAIAALGQCGQAEGLIRLQEVIAPGLGQGSRQALGGAGGAGAAGGASAARAGRLKRPEQQCG